MRRGRGAGRQARNEEEGEIFLKELQAEDVDEDLSKAVG